MLNKKVLGLKNKVVDLWVDYKELGLVSLLTAGLIIGAVYYFRGSPAYRERIEREQIKDCQAYVEMVVLTDEGRSTPEGFLLTRILCDSRCYRTELSDQLKEGIPEIEAHQHAVQECFYKNIAKGDD
ncbi:MAG: hypothetical protein WCV90_04350 [Candidatus Woesearchaeota archaeon]|jgi:hypothetical protein